MLSKKNLALAVALGAGATIALADGAMAQYGGYYSRPYAGYGHYGMPMTMVASYGGYASYGSGYYGGYGGYYGGGRYSGPYRTDSAPLTGGGY